MTMVRMFLTALAVALFFTPAAAEEVVLTGSDAFTAMQKSTCGTTEAGVVRYGIFEGRTYSRVPGEKDRQLFDVLGINVRHCNVVNDDEKGRGFRNVSREIMVYMDPETKQVVDTWDNPWTGKKINVVHVANDPVNMRAMRYERDSSRDEPLKTTLRVYGDLTATSFEVPLFYENPLGGDYQDYVGGRYHAMEIFNTFYLSKNILDPDVASVGQSNIAWSRVAQWLPWLEMGDRPGLMVFNATGFSTFDVNLIPSKLRQILDDRYPEYLTPPPLDDDRPNETSWTVFRKLLEEQ